MDDPHYVILDLEFDNTGAAEALLAALGKVWQSTDAAPALMGTPQTRIIEAVQSRKY
ncbi:MAG TPA: hypothetical protein VM536_19030 [Chloroflexia bacterium]|nr:hypothetical protein [Chloroflexia bacterium]